MSIFEFVCQCLLIILGGVAGYLFDRAKRLAEKKDILEEKQEALALTISQKQTAMEDGMRMMLKIELRRIYSHAIKQGYISYEDEQFAEDIYNRYHALGGNGQGTKMIADIKALEMRRE